MRPRTEAWRNASLSDRRDGWAEVRASSLRGRQIFAQRRDIPNVLLDCDGGKQAEHEGHRVESLLAQSKLCVPQADRQQRDGRTERKPTHTKIDTGHGDALQLIADRLLQGNGGEEAVQQDGEVVTLLVELHRRIP